MEEKVQPPGPVDPEADILAYENDIFGEDAKIMSQSEKDACLKLGMKSLKIEPERPQPTADDPGGTNQTGNVTVKILSPSEFQRTMRETMKVKIIHFLDTILQPHLSNKNCQRIFRSVEGIRNEQLRQLQYNRFIIHPFSMFRWYWDLVMLVTLIVTLIYLPVEVAFYTDINVGEVINMTTNSSNATTPAVTLPMGSSEKSWMAMNIFVDIVFLVDIIFNFRTGYVHSATEEVILNSRKVVIHYLFSWFMIDLVSSVPFDYLYQAFTGTNSDTDISESFYLTLRVLRLTKLLRLLRLFRVARLLRYIHKFEEILEIDSKTISMFNLVLLMFIFCHWNGCIQFMVPFVEGFPSKCWVKLSHLDDPAVPVMERYTASLFRAVSHMMSIGYGSSGKPEHITDMWMILVSMALGGTFYALFIAHLSSIMMRLDTIGKKYEERVSEVKEYLRFRRVPLSLQRRLLEYYDHKYQRKYFDEIGILNEPYMSHPIRQELVMHNCRNLVEKVPFLASAPTDFLFDLICKLEFKVFFPYDVVMHAGKQGDCMYFIEHGRVEIRLPSGRVVNSLGDGTYFGEIALLTDERRVASVLAVEICDMYRLTKASFNDVVLEHPQMKDVLKKAAFERLSMVKRQLQPKNEQNAGPVQQPAASTAGHVEYSSHNKDGNHQNTSIIPVNERSNRKTSNSPIRQVSNRESPSRTPGYREASCSPVRQRSSDRSTGSPISQSSISETVRQHSQSPVNDLTPASLTPIESRNKYEDESSL